VEAAQAALHGRRPAAVSPAVAGVLVVEVRQEVGRIDRAIMHIVPSTTLVSCDKEKAFACFFICQS
jgi:hypothetical protein